MSKLDDVLQNTLNEIQIKLNDEFVKIKTAAKEEYFKSIPWMAEKQLLLEQKREAKEELKKEIEKIKLELENMDSHISSDEVIAFNKEHWTDENPYSVRRSVLETAKLCVDKPAYINIRAFKKIKTQIRNQFNMAITNKQKQQVIMWLQTSVDWKALGINIPNMFEITKVEVKNGTIILDNALPDPTK